MSSGQDPLFNMALKLHDICIWGSATVTTVVCYTCTMWHDPKRCLDRGHWTLCKRLCKASIRGNPTLPSWEVDPVCALCTMTSIPGKDSHAEEEACARDTNNIKEINTSRYPQFIKLYTVCFSFSFGPKNQKENEKMIYVSWYRRQESKL